MALIKTLGFLMLAVACIVVVTFGGFILSIILSIVGFLAAVFLVLGLVAYVLKEYVDDKKESS